jgi:hypothetical protein
MVDIMEYLSAPEFQLIRMNMAFSVFGSICYSIGSVGFFPSIHQIAPALGMWGFIAGSLVVGSSQLWKTHRIGARPSGTFRLADLVADWDAATQAGVELGVCAGAWCFLAGTLTCGRGPLHGAWYLATLCLWAAGSSFFLLAALILGYRRGVMRA